MSVKIVRHKTSPFHKDMLIPVGTKNVKIGALGAENNILVNQVTGVETGTHVVAHKKVDSEPFVKTFADYMAFTFELSKAGNKALRVAMWALKSNGIGRDTVMLDGLMLEDFIAAHQKPPAKITLPTFKRGLAELCKAQIIAKSYRAGMYFINPSCMFNGDRIAFTTILEREASAKVVGDSDE